MKRILIFIILFIFIGCGSASKDVRSTDTDDEHTKSGVIGETYESHNMETNGTTAHENNSSEVADSIQEVNNTVKEGGLGSTTEILAYLTSENYESAQIDHNSREDILNYIKHNSNYSISPILQKLNIDKNSVEIFYESNKSVKVPKKDIYVLSNNEDDSKIFLTFDGDKSYDEVEKYSALVFYHNSLKIPTGFTNIEINSTTKESLLKEIKGAFKQVGINNPEVVVDGEKIQYETVDKNDGKVFQCRIGDNPEAITVTLNSEGSLSLSKYKSELSSISLKTKILCKLEDANGSLEVVSIFKKMQSDISTILGSISTPTVNSSPTPMPTLTPSPTTTPNSTPPTTSGIKNDDIISGSTPTPVPSQTNNSAENDYCSNFELIVLYIDSFKPNELNITVKVKIKNDDISPDRTQIQLFIINTKTHYRFSSEPQLLSYQAEYGTKLKKKIYLYIDDIDAPKYYTSPYKFYFKISDMDTDDICKIEGNSIIEIYGLVSSE